MQMRFVIAVIICLAGIMNQIVRGNMSIIILAMTQPLYNNTNETVPDYGPRYDWSSYDQGLVIGSYFWGSFMLAFLAGILAERYGPRMVAGFGITLGAILSATAPLAANYLWLSILVRVFTGMSMATISPSLQALIANWAPADEKGKFLSTHYANGLGSIFDRSIAGFIIVYLGWHYTFYIIVLMLGASVSVWFYVIYDSPNNHPRITTKEKEFILSKLNTTAIKTKKPWPPFTSMLLCVPFWALVFFHFGSFYSQMAFLTALPKYLSEVHQFNIAETGLLSTIPYIARFVFGMGFGSIGDILFKRKIMSNIAIRKSFSICSHLLPACILIGLTYIDNCPYASVALISLVVASGSATAITSMQNVHDLSPNFAATIFGFIHTVGLSSGFIAPMVVAHFTKERSSAQEWRYVFLIQAGILIGSATIFLIFGSGEIQKWNKIVDDDDGKNTTNEVSLEITSK